MRQKVQMMLLMPTRPSSTQREAPLEERTRRSTSSRQGAGVQEERSKRKKGANEECDVEQKELRGNKNTSTTFSVFQFFIQLEGYSGKSAEYW